MVTRRELLGGIAATLAAAVGGFARADSRFDIEALEAAAGGRIGAAVCDADGTVLAGYRRDERFGMCSTFKLPLAALILRAIDDKALAAERRIPITEDDLVPYAPVTSKRVGSEGMTVVELAAAAQRTSDNVAANLLLRLLGGPAAFTRRLRSLGDGVTRLDRYEPDMNLVAPGDVRDTTSPAAMARTVARMIDDSYLSPERRAQLETWMLETRTGLSRLRAGLDPDWRVGNKTGTGIAATMPNRTNDVACIWFGDGQRFVVSAYVEADGHYDRIRDEDEAVLARIGALATQRIDSSS